MYCYSGKELKSRCETLDWWQPDPTCRRSKTTSSNHQWQEYPKIMNTPEFLAPLGTWYKSKERDTERTQQISRSSSFPRPVKDGCMQLNEIQLMATWKKESLTEPVLGRREVNFDETQSVMKLRSSGEINTEREEIVRWP